MTDSFNRRQRVERSIGALKGGFVDISRKFQRVFGLTKAMLILGLSVAGYNIERAPFVRHVAGRAGEGLPWSLSRGASVSSNPSTGGDGITSEEDVPLRARRKRGLMLVGQRRCLRDTLPPPRLAIRTVASESEASRGPSGRLSIRRTSNESMPGGA